MRFTTDRDAFRAALAKCSGVVEKRSPMPILSNVLLDMEGGELTVRATNAREEITTSMRIEGRYEAGKVCVSFAELVSRVAAMPSGPVTFADKGNKATLTSGQRVFKIATIGAESLPPMTPPSGANFQIDSTLLDRVLSAVRFAVGEESNQAQTQAALFEVSENVLTVAAFNGRCLSSIAVRIEAADALARIPLRALLAAQSLCEDDDRATVRIDGARVFLTVGATTLAALIPATPFPPYRQALPDDVGPAVVVDRQALIGSLKAVSVSSNEYGRVRLVAKDGTIKLSCGEDGADSVTAECGVSFDASVAAQYALGALQSIDADSVEIRCPQDPDMLMIRPVEGADLERLCVVVPMMAGAE